MIPVRPRRLCARFVLNRPADRLTGSRAMRGTPASIPAARVARTCDDSSTVLLSADFDGVLVDLLNAPPGAYLGGGILRTTTGPVLAQIRCQRRGRRLPRVGLIAFRWLRANGTARIIRRLVGTGEGCDAALLFEVVSRPRCQIFLDAKESLLVRLFCWASGRIVYQWRFSWPAGAGEQAHRRRRKWAVGALFLFPRFLTYTAGSVRSGMRRSG